MGGKKKKKGEHFGKRNACMALQNKPSLGNKEIHSTWVLAKHINFDSPRFLCLF
jgi:hypothetical protein